MLIPFGSERFQSETSWAKLPHPDLFPPPLTLDALDHEQAKILRSWFVAHVNITPRKTTPRKQKSRRSKEKDNSFVQLSLLD
jgi:deoxyribodipyrimidine photo-lyase